MTEMEAGEIVTWLDEPSLLADYPNQPPPYAITPAMEREARSICHMAEREALGMATH